MWLILFLLLGLAPRASQAAPVTSVTDYKPERCAWCQRETWCELRSNGKRQCRGCKAVLYFKNFLYPPVRGVMYACNDKALRDLFATVDMETGLRRFRSAYISMGKQNGKSNFMGGVPIYHISQEDEIDPEVYGAAGAKEQAGLVFKSTSKMIRANPVLIQKFKVLDSVKKIVRRDGLPGSYEVLSADGKLKDGIRGSINIRDEIHRWTTQSAEILADVMTKGQISRRQPLDIQITTAGVEFESELWFRQYERAKLIQADPTLDPSHYVMIFEADSRRVEEEKGYWKSREARLAANPSHEAFGGHLTDAALQTELDKAVSNPAERSKYLRYHLNVPIKTHEEPVIDIPAWQRCGGGIDLRKCEKLDLEALIDQWGLRGRPCYAGVDASWTTDLTSVVAIFPPINESDVWTFLPFFWAPLERIAEIERVCRVPLTSWAARGFLTLTPGNAIDLRSVLDRIRWMKTMFELREVPYDPQHFRTEAMNLQEEGIQAVEVGQVFLQLSYPTKFLLAAYLDGKVRHGNHPILNWMAACVQLQYDHKDNCQPSKPERMKSTKRIDGIQAIVTGLSRALVAPGPSPYETRGVLVLG